jgi:hypothetical protein
MLRLKINLRVRRSVRVKCPRHPRYNPERDGAGAIRGGCRYCLAMYELYAGKLAVERSLQALEQHITRCESCSGAALRKEHA